MPPHLDPAVIITMTRRPLYFAKLKSVIFKQRRHRHVTFCRVSHFHNDW